MVRELPKMIRYLKDRGNVYVLFNYQRHVAEPRNGQELIEAGMDELRVSLDAAEPATFKWSAARTCSTAS